GGRRGIARPLPDVADHVEEAEWISGEAADGGTAREAVFGAVHEREVALPGVGSRAALRVAGRPIERVIAAARARRELPLGLARQLATEPARVGERVFVGDVNDRLVRARRARARAGVGLTPARLGLVAPRVPGGGAPLGGRP